MTVDLERSANDLTVALADALRHAPQAPGKSIGCIGQLVLELGKCVPTLNLPQPESIVPSEKMLDMFADQSKPKIAKVLDCLRPAIPRCSWFRADEFYPEARHRVFSEKVWGALVLGQTDAVFATDDRLIALLILIEPHTTYPLHAHRIEETYLVLSGDAEWSHDGVAWEQLGAGAVFHNQPWEPHTMRTGKEAIVALGLYLPPFGWEGGLLEAEAE